jgi:hypothetical protein
LIVITREREAIVDATAEGLALDATAQRLARRGSARIPWKSCERSMPGRASQRRCVLFTSTVAPTPTVHTSLIIAFWLLCLPSPPPRLAAATLCSAHV